GYEPEEIFNALPRRKRLRQPAFSTVTLPTLLARRTAGFEKKSTPGTSVAPEVAQQVLLKTLRTLLDRMRQAVPVQRGSTGSNYVETATHYSEDDHAKKQAFVRETLDAYRPKHVLDVGANTGAYSIMAADAGAAVVSIETDSAAVNRLALSLKS